MPRRKNKRLKRQTSRGSPTQQQQDQSTSLEEDLRKQRLRQQQREAERKAMEAIEQERRSDLPDSANNANDVEQEDREWDPIPGTDHVLPQHLLVKRRDTYPSRIHSTDTSSICWQWIGQQAPTLRIQQRQRIRHFAHNRYLWENLQVNPRATALYSRKLKWLDHALPDGTHCAWDMTCKYYLHPSARSFDVAMMSAGDVYPNNTGHGVLHHPLPTIATAVQGGWGLFQPPRGRDNQRIRTLRCKPVYAIRMHESSNRCGSIIRTGHHPAPYRFHCYQLPHATNYFEAELYEPAYDFCFGSDLVIFSSPLSAGRHQSSCTPLFLPLDRPNAELRALNVQNFPQSDALRVEMTCHHDKYIAFGHRNGEVSLLDLRQSQSCNVILANANGEKNSSPADMGSATDLAFLSSSATNGQEHHHLLVKRSFGTCQLHDLRKLSTSPSSLLYNLSVPDHPHQSQQRNGVGTQQHVHKTLSANCNGFFLDPATKQTLWAPFMNMKQEPCLGMWSLTTGEMVDSKVLVTNAPPVGNSENGQGRDVYFVEVCQRATPGYAFNKGKPLSDPASIGVWLKCGKIAQCEKMTTKVGSLYHLRLPGRWEKED